MIFFCTQGVVVYCQCYLGCLNHISDFFVEVWQFPSDHIYSQCEEGSHHQCCECLCNILYYWAEKSLFLSPLSHKHHVVQSCFYKFVSTSHEAYSKEILCWLIVFTNYYVPYQWCIFPELPVAMWHSSKLLYLFK